MGQGRKGLMMKKTDIVKYFLISILVVVVCVTFDSQLSLMTTMSRTRIVKESITDENNKIIKSIAPDQTDDKIKQKVTEIVDARMDNNAEYICEDVTDKNCTVYNGFDVEENYKNAKIAIDSVEETRNNALIAMLFIGAITGYVIFDDHKRTKSAKKSKAKQKNGKRRKIDS